MGDPCPLTPASVALYVAYLFNLKYAPKTIQTYLSAISFLHKIQGFADPTKDFIIQKLVAGVHRLRPSVDMRLPITAPILSRLLRAADLTLVGFNKILCQAMFSFAFHTYTRRGELAISNPSQAQAVLQIQDVHVIFKQGAAKEIKVKISRFKHNTTGQPHFISFETKQQNYCPVVLLLNYLRKRGNSPGSLFCDVAQRPISRHFFDSKLRVCLNFCNLDSKCYKGHSFRIGAASWDAQNGVPDSQIRLRGRWKSDAFKKYIRVTTG